MHAHLRRLPHKIAPEPFRGIRGIVQAIAVIAQHDWHWYYPWLQPIAIVALWCTFGALLLIGATIAPLLILKAPTWHELTYTGRSILRLILSLQAGVPMLLAPLWVVMEINNDRRCHRLYEILSTPLPASGYICGKLALPLMTCIIITQSLLPIEIIIGMRFCVPPAQIIGASVALIPYLFYTIGMGVYIALLLKALPLAVLAMLTVIWLPVLVTTTPVLVVTPITMFNPFAMLAHLLHPASMLSNLSIGNPLLPWVLILPLGILCLCTSADRLTLPHPCTSIARCIAYAFVINAWYATGLWWLSSTLWRVSMTGGFPNPLLSALALTALHAALLLVLIGASAQVDGYWLRQAFVMRNHQSNGHISKWRRITSTWMQAMAMPVTASVAYACTWVWFFALIVRSDIAPLTATVRYSILHQLTAGIATLTLGTGMGSLASTLRMGYDIDGWGNAWAIRGVAILLTALWFIMRAFTDGLQGGYSIITWVLSISPYVILWHGLPIARIPPDSAWVWRAAPYSSMILAIVVSALCLIIALTRLRRHFA